MVDLELMETMHTSFLLLPMYLWHAQTNYRVPIERDGSKSFGWLRKQMILHGNRVDCAIYLSIDIYTRFFIFLFVSRKSNKKSFFVPHLHQHR